ncbi:MAG TPA: HDOD domain-containing protein [bacterium]|nr:HDOD domain-containing protein [bacterium]
MVRTNPTIAKNPAVDKDSVKSNLKYLQFGIRLWTLRERQKIRSKILADKLGIPFHEYRRYEAGEILPDQDTLQQLAQILKVELSQLTQWKSKELHQSGKPAMAKGAHKYLYHWDLAEQQFRKNWLSHHEKEQRHEHIIHEIIILLKKESCSLKTLPILPLGLYLVLDALISNQHHDKKFIHDISDFVVENETLAQYMARDPVLGCFLFVAANRVYFSKAPLDGIEDCFNRLTVSQFSDLVFMATTPEGVHANYETLPSLQRFIEFSSLAVLMVRELKDYLPDNVNYHHLYLAALLQGVGTYALHTSLQTMIDQHPEWYVVTKPELAEDVHCKKSLAQHLNWEFHPIISGMIAANWGLPHEVVQTLIEHHKQPTNEVSPVCAVLKLINFFVDCDFPRIKANEIQDLLAKYPQVSIDPQALLTVSQHMNKMSEYLIEMNSVVLDNTQVTSLGSATQKEIEILDAGADPICSKPVWRHQPSAKTEFRFDTEYSKILTIDCSQHLNQFLTQHLSPKKGESLRGYGERVQNLQLALYLALSGDLADVSARFQLSEQEIALRLSL